jgi:hypothetical protein
MTKKYDIPKFTRYSYSVDNGVIEAKDGEYITTEQLRRALTCYMEVYEDRRSEYDADEDDPMKRQHMDQCDAKLSIMRHFLTMIDGD